MTPQPITLSRAALLDLLTTAACIGRDSQSAQTRGNLTDILAAYGFRDYNLLLDKQVARAEAAVSA